MCRKVSPGEDVDQKFLSDLSLLHLYDLYTLDYSLFVPSVPISHELMEKLKQDSGSH